MPSHHLRELSSEVLDRVEASVARFEEAWRNGPRPDLAAFLPKDGPERKAVLRELIYVELELALRAGEPVRIEMYLKRFPELKADPRGVIDLLAKEFRFRKVGEPDLSGAEYERRFPGLKKQLAARLEAEMATIVGVKPASGTTAFKAAAPARSLPEVLYELSEGLLLSAKQCRELLDKLKAQFTSASSLLAELTRRGWLTAFQADMVLCGRGRELVLGPYIVVDRLGEGGMGQVFKARHQVMKRLVAVKVIRKGVLSFAEQVQRFYREIEAVARLSHPNIVLAHDAGLVGDVHFFAMEYVEGVDLARHLGAEGRLTVDKACDYVRQAALGLQHVHERGLVHRDVKPSNLLLCKGENGTEIIKILDLGLARIYEKQHARRLTQVGEVMGTADYIAPEQATLASQVDIRADIYSLGCTLYHLIAGQPVFVGGSMVDKLRRHQKDEPRPLGKIRALPDGLDAVLAKMLAKRPADRYATPRDVADALAPYCPRPANLPSANSVVSSKGQPALSRRRVLIGSAVMAAAVIVAALILFFRSATPPVVPTGEPMSLHALVGQPAKLPGVKSWTVETTGHRGVIPDIQLSPDGKWLASAGHDGTVRLWNIEAGFKLERVFVGTSGWQSVAWSPDGKRLATLSLLDFGASGFEKSEVAIWEVASGKHASVRLKSGGWVSLAWSPNNQKLVLGHYQDETLLIGLDGAIHDEGTKLGKRCEFRPDGKTLASFVRGQMRFFNVIDLEEVHAFAVPEKAIANDDWGKVLNYAWSPNGDRLALINEQYFWVLDAQSGKPLVQNDQPAKEKSRRQRVAWSADGKRCALTVETAGYGVYLEILDAQTGELFRATEPVFGRCTALAWIDHDKRLVAATGPHNHIAGGSTALHVYQVNEGGGDKRTFASSAPQESIPWLTFSQSHETFPVSRDGKRVRKTTARDAHRSPDGSMTVSLGTQISRYDLVTDRPLPPTQPSPPLDGNAVLAWSHDSQRIVIANGGGLARIFDARSGDVVSAIKELQGKTTLYGVALSPDRKTLALAPLHHIFWYDVESGKQKQQCFHFGTPRIAYSHDGKLFAAASDRKVTVWDADAVVAQENAAPLTSWSTPGAVIELAFSQDSKILATAGNNGAILPAVVRFWDPRTGRPLGCVHALEGDKGLAVRAEGHVRRTGGKEERELVYIVETERGQETLSFDEFRTRFGWNNEAEHAKLKRFP